MLLASLILRTSLLQFFMYLMRFLLHHTLIDMHASDFMGTYLDPPIHEVTDLHLSLQDGVHLGAQLIPLEVICDQELLSSS